MEQALELGQEFYNIVKDGDILALEEFYKKTPNLLSSKIWDGNGKETIFHYTAKYGNTDVLDWVYTHTEKNAQDILNSENDFGHTVYDNAAQYNSIDVLDWLYEHIQNKELLRHVSQYNSPTVFHNAARGYNSIDVLNWLFEHTKEYALELLTYNYSNGRVFIFNETIFHFSSKQGNISKLNWFYEHTGKYAKELLTHLFIKYQSVFHLAIKGICKIDVLDWLYEHLGEYAPKLLITIVDDNGNTAYNNAENAIGPKKTEYLNWFNKLSLPGVSSYRRNPNSDRPAILNILNEVLDEFK